MAMDDARDWLKQHGVPMLVEGGLRELVEAKPADPAAFLSQYFGNISNKGRGKHADAGAGARKKKPPGMQIETEVLCPEKMNDATLAALWRGASRSNVVVVDVRPDDAGGRIPGSEHVPCDDLVSDASGYAERWAGKQAVVFISVQSPDLDQTAAVPLMQSMREQGRSTDGVFILMGGLRGWMITHSGDPALVEKYDAALWGRPQAPPPQPKKKKGAPSMQISVPEAPDKMSPTTLALVLGQESTGTVVVDVRPDQAGGRIPRSEYIPCDDIIRDAAMYAERWGAKDAVVFVSLQSPDLDQMAASPVLQLLREQGSKTQVFILLGGLRGFFSDYSDNPALVEGFEGQPSADAADAAPQPRKQSGKKKRPGMQIAVPEAPEKMAPGELAVMLRGELTSPKRGVGTGLVVVDVRPDLAGGKIVRSEHIPCDEFVRDAAAHAERWSERSAVVFASVQSPDLDQTAAIPLMQSLHERGSSVEVFVLLGGLRGWMADYHDDPTLVEDYSAAAWDAPSQPALPSEGDKKGKKGPPRMQISVPEAPDKMNDSELSLLVKAKSDTFLVVDVRPDQSGGKIPGSVHIPCEDFVQDAAKHAESAVEKDAVVFVSVQSPDLDQSAATALMQALAESGDTTTNVFVLLGGLRGWVSAHAEDPALFEDYDPAAWAKPGA